MDSTQDPADDVFLARLRSVLGQAPDAFDDVAVQVVRDRVCDSVEDVATEGGDSSR